MIPKKRKKKIESRFLVQVSSLQDMQFFRSHVSAVPNLKRNSYLYDDPSLKASAFFLVHLHQQGQPMGLTMFEWVLWNTKNSWN